MTGVQTCALPILIFLSLKIITRGDMSHLHRCSVKGAIKSTKLQPWKQHPGSKAPILWKGPETKAIIAKVLQLPNQLLAVSPGIREFNCDRKLKWMLSTRGPSLGVVEQRFRKRDPQGLTFYLYYQIGRASCRERV